MPNLFIEPNVGRPLVIDIRVKEYIGEYLLVSTTLKTSSPCRFELDHKLFTGGGNYFVHLPIGFRNTDWPLHQIVFYIIWLLFKVVLFSGQATTDQCSVATVQFRLVRRVLSGLLESVKLLTKRDLRRPLWKILVYSPLFRARTSLLHSS